MRIVICDDDQVFVENLKNTIENLYGCEIQLVCCNNPFALVTYVGDDAKGDVDLIIMDIHLKDQNGINVAQSIMVQYPNIEYIFVSQDIMAVQDIFKVTPIYFLYKPVKADYLKDALIKSFRIMDDKVTSKLKLKNAIIKLSDIYYIESDRRLVHVHTRNTTYSDYVKLNEVEENLDNNFLRVHQSYIVNMDKIRLVQGDRITLYNNVIIPISRSRIKEIPEIINKYLDV